MTTPPPPPQVPAVSINTITEANVALWFLQNAAMLPGVTINQGQSIDQRTVPIVIISAESAHGHPDLGATPKGNFEVTVRIYVYSSGDDELAANPNDALALHRIRVGATESIMNAVNGLKEVWSASHFGQLYALWFVSNEIVTADRRLGNVLTYTLVARYASA